MSEPHQADDRAPDSPSPLRWIFVAVPALVIFATAIALAMRWAGVPAGDEIVPPPAAVEQSADAQREASEAPAIEHVPITPTPDPPGPTFDVAEVLALLPAADIADGAARFRVCTVCHSAAPDAGHRLGPNLWGIVGRAKAAHADFRYSDALRSRDGTWTLADLAAYLNNPRTYVPGTSMTFAGIRDPAKLANLLAHLQTLTDDRGQAAE